MEKVTKYVQSIVITSHYIDGNGPHIEMNTYSGRALERCLIDNFIPVATIRSRRDECLNCYKDLKKRIEKRISVIAESPEYKEFEMPIELINKI